MTRLVLVVPLVAITLAVALTGCSKLDAHTAGADSAPPVTITGAPSPAAGSGAASGTPAGASSSSLDSITQDLSAADDANSQSGSDQQSADQASATSDG
jgi:hypothetical protein